MSTQRYYSSDTLKAAVKKHNLNEESVVVNDNDTDDALDLCVNLTTFSGEDYITVKTPHSLIQIKRSSTKTHDIETAEVIFDNEETSL